MTTPRIPGTDTDWELVSGLPNDQDGWIKGAKFGSGREEYAAKAGQAVMLHLPLLSPEGEEIGMQSFSVGKGWIVSDDGLTITHPTRSNIVKTSMYGRLIAKVTAQLGVDMKKYGVPTRADTWENLGFHWMLEKHTTVSGEEKEGLMPTEFLGDTLPFEAGAASAPAIAAVAPETMAKLVDLARKNPAPAFRRAVLKIPEVAANDALLADVMDASPTGFWARSQTPK